MIAVPLRTAVPMKLRLLPREEVWKPYCFCLRRKRISDVYKRGMSLREKSEEENSPWAHSFVEDKGRLQQDFCLQPLVGNKWLLHFLIQKESCHSSLFLDTSWFPKCVGWVTNFWTIHSCPGFCKAEWEEEQPHSEDWDTIIIYLPFRTEALPTCSN